MMWQIAFLDVDYSGRGRHWWDVLPRTWRTYDDARRYVGEIAGDLSRWVVQPVWGAP